ncbi:MAG: sarcosine oxidase subunit gamma [Rhabdaerophilum sp.]
MVEPPLKPRDAFAGLVLPDVAGVALTPSPMRHRLFFQAEEQAVEMRLRATGFARAPAMLRAEIADQAALLRLGPDEWWLLSEVDFTPEMRKIAGSGAIEISHGYAGIAWVGPRAALALSAGCPLDLHISAFPIGMVTRTLYGKCEVLLWRQGEERFHIEVARSYLAAILAFFGETARHLPQS